MRRLIVLVLPLCAGGCAGTGPLPSGKPPTTGFVPATVRVAFDERGLTRIKARGLADRATGRRVAADDPVRIASISKLIVSLGVMRLAEAGRLDLDADVSRWLGFPVRNPAFPDAPITLRLLLSHRSSLTDDADYVLPLERTMAEQLAEPKAWDAAHPPGDWFHYTNLNFGVIAAAMEGATGERFDRLMTAQVFAPLGLDACFNWSGCSDRAIARAVVLYDATGAAVRDDLRGKRPDCPVVPARDGTCDLARWRPAANGASFSPQGGVRISMRDLARVGRLLLGDGMLDGARFLAPASIAAMRAPLWTFDGANGDPSGGIYCAYGLATELVGTPSKGCADDPFGDGIPRIGHAGDAYGVKAGLWIDRARGTGIAYFTTAVAPDAARGRSAWTKTEEKVARGRF